MEMFVAIGMFIVGLVLIFAEIFLPGAIMGLLGFGLVVGAIYTGFRESQGLGVTLLVLGVLTVPVFAVLWYHVLSKKFAVRRTLKDAFSAPSGLDELIGKEGVAITNLRPAGAAEVGGKRVDVVTDGEMIDKGTRVEVVEVEGNRVVVRPVRA